MQVAIGHKDKTSPFKISNIAPNRSGLLFEARTSSGDHTSLPYIHKEDLLDSSPKDSRRSGPNLKKTVKYG